MSMEILVRGFCGSGVFVNTLRMDFFRVNIFLILIFCISKAVVGDGTAIIRFMSYTNVLHKTRSGHCCENLSYSNCPPNQCDPVFDICVDPLPQVPTRTCIYGQTNSSVYENQDQVNFGKTIATIPNPWTFSFPRWNNGIGLIVVIKDHDDGLNGDSDDLIGKIDVEFTEVPTPNILVPSSSTTRTYSDGFASLTMVYSFNCNQYYYGDCSVFCKADHVHYTCNSTGHKICMPGWKGLDCRTDLHKCTPNPCQNGATCVSDVTYNVVCVCLAGFTGKYCNTKLHTTVTVTDNSTLSSSDYRQMMTTDVATKVYSAINVYSTRMSSASTVSSFETRTSVPRSYDTETLTHTLSTGNNVREDFSSVTPTTQETNKTFVRLTGGSGSSNTGRTVAVVVGVLTGLVLLMTLGILLYRIMKKKSSRIEKAPTCLDEPKFNEESIPTFEAGISQQVPPSSTLQT